MDSIKKGKDLIVGIDPGSRILGIAMFDKKDLVASYAIRTVEMEWDKRLLEIEQVIKELIFRYGIKKAFIENYAFGSKFGLPKSGEVGWAIRRIFHQFNIPILLITPITARCFLLGHLGKKSEVRLGVYKRFNKTAGEDEADAIALGSVGQHLFFSIPGKNKYEKNILKRIKKAHEKVKKEISEQKKKGDKHDLS